MGWRSKQGVKRSKERDVSVQAYVGCDHPSPNRALLLFDLLQLIRAVKIGMKICIPLVWNTLATRGGQIKCFPSGFHLAFAISTAETGK